MKKLLAAASVGVLLTGCSTMELSENPLNQYQKIVEIPNTSQDQIYDGSKQWFAKNFHDSNSVIKYDNAEKGSIIGKGNMKFECLGDVVSCYGASNDSLRFTVKVDSKDNRARVSFEDLILHTPSSVTSGIRSPEVNMTPKFEYQIRSVKVMLDNTVDSLSGDVKQTVGSEDW